MQISTARFWIYDSKNDSHVKLSLKAGQSVEFFNSHNTDEGWNSSFTRYTFDGGSVLRETETDGCDCDGRLSRSYVGVSHYWQLKAHSYEGCPSDVRLPKWDDVEARQRDYSAEAMGY